MNNMPKWVVTGLGGLLIAFVALLLIDKGTQLNDKFRDKNPTNTIGVTAEGKVKAVPDMATVNLGVITQGASPSAVTDENSKKVNKIVDYVKQQGISKDDISTSQFNIYPQYNYNNGKNEIVGYELRQTVSITIKGVDKSTETLNKILQGAVSQGANEINGVSLSFDDPDNLRQQAREEAIAKAKEKAQELARAAGLKLGRVISVNEAGSTYPQPYYGAAYGMGGGMMAEAKSASPNIEPGQQDIVESMTVVFEVK